MSIHLLIKPIGIYFRFILLEFKKIDKTYLIMKSFYTTLMLLFFFLFAQDGTLVLNFGDNRSKLISSPGEGARLYALAKSENQLIAIPKF